VGARLKPFQETPIRCAIPAAAGLTSRAIADRLFLSARMVDTHLARIYAKLRVSSRSQLRGALGLTS